MKKLIFIFVLLLAAPSTLFAQLDTSEHWFYDLVSGALIAYNLDGENRTLIEDGVSDLTILLPLDSQTVLVRIELDTGAGLVILTPDSVQEISASFDVNLVDGPVIARSDTHVVMIDTARYGRVSGILIDLEARTAELLSGLLWNRGQEVGTEFSADGETLRYFRTASEASKEWNLLERDLATGEEHSLYVTVASSERGLMLNVSQYGEHWLLREEILSTDTFRHTLVYSDGRSEILSETPTRNPILMQLAEGFLISHESFCEVDCALELRSLDDGEIVEYSLPESLIQEPIQVLRRDETDGSLLILSGNEFVYLELSGQAQSLGYGAPDVMGIGVRHNMVYIEIDRQWLILADSNYEPTQWWVWNTDDATVILEESFAGLSFVSALLYDTGILLEVYGPGSEPSVIRMLYEDRSVLMLPASPARYLELLPDGTLLRSTSGDDEQPAGIYHYDPVTDESRLLLEYSNN